MRSSQQLRTSLAIHKRLDSLYGSLSQRDPWDDFALQRNKRGIQAVEAELSSQGDGLDISFDGLGVVGSSIELRRLQDLMYPLGRSIRAIGRDTLFTQGKPNADVPAAQLVEPIFAGTFSGSFGIHLMPPLAAEQMTFDGTLFDRIIARLLTVFRLARTDTSSADIFNSLTGLRANTLKPIKEFSEELGKSDLPAIFRWHGNEPIRVLPEGAIYLAEVIGQTTAEEETRTVVGKLVGGDITSWVFHIVVDDARTGRPRNFRGSVEEGEARRQMNGIGFGSNVEAVLKVIRLDNPLVPIPKESYVMSSVKAFDPR